MGIGDIVTEKKKQIDEWLKNQSTPVEIAAISAGSAVQGTAADFFFFWFLVFVVCVAAIDPGKQQFLPNAFEAHLVFHSLTELFSLSLSLSTLCDGIIQAVCSATCSGR